MDSLGKLITDNIEALVVAAIGFATIFSNASLQKKNIGIAARQRLHEQVTDWMREIRDKVTSLATDYRDQAQQIADIGDGVRQKRLQGGPLEEAINKRYDHLINTLIPKSFDVRKSVQILLNRIDAVPILSQEVEKPLAALKKEYKTLGEQLDMDFDRIMAIGANVIPDQKHFEVFAKDITKSQADLLVFSELIDDLEVLVNNVLVKDIYGERRPKDSSNRSKQLLLQGIVDPQLKN